MAGETSVIGVGRSKDARVLLGERLALAGLAVVMVLAFGLRVFLLDGQSLWYDEGVSVVMAPRDLATITANAAGDIHPPLYYYLLHFWTMLVGTSEFGARFLSVIYGVLLVPIVFVTGRRLFGALAGLIAAFFAATAPFLIYYSQEARMYMQVTAFGALSTYLFARLTADDESETSGRGRMWFEWAAYCLMTSLTLYSHYFGVTLVVAQNLHFWLLSGRQRRLWSRWVLSQVVVGVSFLPWLFVSLGQLGGWPSVSEAFTLDVLLRRVFLVFSFGLSSDAAATPLRELVFLVVLVSSTLYLAVNRHKTAARNLALVVLYGLVPIIIMYGASLQRPMYNPKFLLLASPAYYLALGVGTASLALGVHRMRNRIVWPGATVVCSIVGSVVAVVAVASISYSSFHAASAYYFDPKYARDNYRGLVQYVESRARPGDVIILNAPGQVEIFDYYYRGDIPRVPLPRQRPIDEKQTIDEVERVVSAHSRVWLVLWAVPESDPRGMIEGWLDHQSFKALNTWFGTVRLCLYNVAESAEAISQDVDLHFGDRIVLRSWEVGAGEVRPGEALPLTLTWAASRPVTERYTVFVHVLDANELICGQRDSEPGGGARVTTSWAPGEVISDRYAVPVELGTPPGEYRLEIGLYQPQTGQRLPITSAQGDSLGDRYLLGPIRIGRALSAPPVDLLGFEQPSSAIFDGRLRLLGYSIDALGRPADYVDYSNRDTLCLALFWQAKAPLGDYKVEVVLRDAANQDALRSLSSMAGGQYPTVAWQPGEVVRDQHRVPLSDLKGEYVVSIALRTSEAQEPVGVASGPGGSGYLELGKIRVGE